MSWKHAGHLLSGPPSSSSTASSSTPIPRHLRPNFHGLNAFQRERQLASHYRAFDAPEPASRSEWDVLRENHRFIRDDEVAKDVSWEERLARAYESKLFKEFALIDLKHYKSKRLALRWRTAPEVVEGIGEDSCASLRCKHHRAQPTSPERVEFDTPRTSRQGRGREGRKMPALRAFELPFVYEEAGERREALVKVRLCRRCTAKLVWKPGEEVVGSEDDERDERVDRVEREFDGRGEKRERLRDSATNIDGRVEDGEGARRGRDEGQRDRHRDRRKGDGDVTRTLQRERLPRQGSRSRSRSPRKRDHESSRLPVSSRM